MIPTLPRSSLSRHTAAAYMLAFFAFLFLPLAIVAVFAFNDANYPAPPWRGFTLDWFFGGPGRTGLFSDAPLLKSIGTSAIVAVCVTVLSVAVGTVNAWLLERARFRGKSALSLLMLTPLVIPGVILGISILAFASRLAQFADDTLGSLRLLLSGPKSSAGRPMPDGHRPGPGGWNRIHLIVDDISAEVARLRAAGVEFRNDIVSGPGGSQILLKDPSGNLVELFQPARR